MQFLSEKRLNGCHIFGRFGFFKKLNPNQMSVYLALTTAGGCYRQAI